MRVLVTGATGFVGSAVVSCLLDAGHQVVGLTRSDAGAVTLAATGVTPQRGDLRDVGGLQSAAREADAVIHTAFEHDFSRLAESCEMDRRAIEALGAALEGSDKPLVVTSGLPAALGHVATEEDCPPAGAHGMPRVSEHTAMALVRRGVCACVVRMPQVHDRAKQGFASYLLAHAHRTGMSAYVGAGSNQWAAVHRLDAAQLFRLVLERGETGSHYHAVAEEGVSTREIAEAIARRLDISVVSLPVEASADHFGWLDRIVRMDVPASSALTRERLGWHPKAAPNFLSDILSSDGDVAVE